MASEDDRPVYSVDDLDDEDEEIEEDDLEDDDTSSSNLAAAATPSNLVTVASAADPSVQFAITPISAAKPIAAAEDPRRLLFQRLWTDEDEIELLRGFLDYNLQRGGGAAAGHYHHDTAAFYDQIRSKLQLDFNKNQLVEKLRRLKKKYRTVMAKINSGKEYAFKTPHDQATFEISKKIWFEPVPPEEGELNPNPNFINFHYDQNGGVDLNLKGSARPRKRSKPVEMPQFNQPIPQMATGVANPVPGLIEETVRSCLTPILKELVQSVTSNSKRGLGIGGIGEMSPLGFGFGGLDTYSIINNNNIMDEKWRKQHILELEVYSKRLELVQGQIKSTIEDLTKSL